MQPTDGPPPSAADVVHLRATDATGAAFTALCLALTAGALGLSQAHLVVSGGVGWALWGLGQLLLAVALLQWFVLLHECGHGVLFRRRSLNRVVGHVAGFFSTIPFSAWAPVHALHHKWTGWQDVDPTTQSLVPRPLKPAERWLMNLCWRRWIPAFSVIYRVSNFWNVPRLRRRLSPAIARRIAVNAAVLAVLYGALAAVIGPLNLLLAIGPGVVLSLMMLDPIMMSQHTHVPLQLSHGEPVEAIGARDQAVFTRSLRFPRWFSAAILLHFDAHELHHMYPFVPGYRLGAIDHDPGNSFHWWTWIRRVRRMPADVFLFQNRDDTGADV